jgi:CRP-like cAMP-binding protein
MDIGALGKMYEDGEVIVQQGEIGNCMFVIQEGQVEVFLEEEGQQTDMAVLSAGDFFGEMAIFDREVRSATVRAIGPARILTVDKKNFLRRISKDPSLAFRLVETMSRRIRSLQSQLK